jgi:sugar transferase EpsL
MTPRPHPANGPAKRAVDVVLAALALVVLAPCMLALALAVALLLGRPVVFRQVRPGRGGRPFELLKFRTMTDHAAPDGTPSPDAQRPTRFGQWLRRTSLDELPELVNVLRGDMSLVGPRPLLLEYLPLYSAEQARRHEVPAGITGWAQVNGRNALTWDQKFALDVWYVDHWSLGLDVRILLRTLVAVFRATGINQPGSATQERFRGSVQ